MVNVFFPEEELRSHLKTDQFPVPAYYFEWFILIYVVVALSQYFEKLTELCMFRSIINRRSIKFVSMQLSILESVI